MAFAPGWPPLAAAMSCGLAAPRAGSAFRPERPPLSGISMTGPEGRIAMTSETDIADRSPARSALACALPGLRRLKTRKDFLRVAAKGRKAATPGLVLQAAPAIGDQGALSIGLGFTVSRKVGNSVARNRARRRLREAARAVMPHAATPGMDYVIIGRLATLDRPYRKLLADLEKAVGAVARGVRS